MLSKVSRTLDQSQSKTAQRTIGHKVSATIDAGLDLVGHIGVWALDHSDLSTGLYLCGAPIQCSLGWLLYNMIGRVRVHFGNPSQKVHAKYTQNGELEARRTKSKNVAKNLTADRMADVFAG